MTGDMSMAFREVCAKVETEVRAKRAMAHRAQHLGETVFALAMDLRARDERAASDQALEAALKLVRLAHQLDPV
jgi:hypothetical protein